jgi:hypothetical protein
MQPADRGTIVAALLEIGARLRLTGDNRCPWTRFRAAFRP